MAKKSTPSEPQVKAIRVAERIAKEIESPLGDAIVRDYRSGAPIRKIAKRYIPNEVNISGRVAESAVYEVLLSVLDDSERIQLGREHMVERGKEDYRMGRRLFSLTKEQRTEISRKVGNNTKKKGLEYLL